MPPHRPHVPAAPQPTRVFFDPFNSSSTGHQHAEDRLSGSTSWKDSRTHKLSHQFRDSTGRGGERLISTLVDAGYHRHIKHERRDDGGREAGITDLREKGWLNVREVTDSGRKRPWDCLSGRHSEMKRQKSGHDQDEQSVIDHGTAEIKDLNFEGPAMVRQEIQKGPACTPTTPPPQIFRHLNLYLNGSTAPAISDHKLKQLFVQHGGSSSISLGRRTVTHVILGSTCGGGLAAGKFQKEVSLVRGKGIKYVTAQWVLDSVEKGVRQPEANYVPKNLNRRIGGSGQASVRDIFKLKAD